MMSEFTAEDQRLGEVRRREQHWQRWGPYLSERQWATVREDYSEDGDAWRYFPHDHARSRAYRWGEDGLLGITDNKCRLCFALALWNERDNILKERLFGLTNPEGNHGEDVKEQYFYTRATPTYSFLRQQYKYPQAAFPYAELVKVNCKRSTQEREYELLDTGVFDQGRYFDIVAEYAKASPNDLLIKITVANRGPDPAPLHLIPQLWFRNTWRWQGTHEAGGPRPHLVEQDGRWQAEHDVLGRFIFEWEDPPTESLFTENETNDVRLLGTPDNVTSAVKDAFHEHVIAGEADVLNAEREGTKAGLHYHFILAPNETRSVHGKGGVEAGYLGNLLLGDEVALVAQTLAHLPVKVHGVD